MEKEQRNRWLSIAIIALVYVALISIPFSRWITSESWNYGIALGIRLLFLVFAGIYAKINKLPPILFHKPKWRDLRFIPFLLFAITNLFVGLPYGNGGSSLHPVWIQIPIILFSVLSEEFIFRVLLAKEVQNQTKKKWKAILWSAFFFAIIHFANISSVATILPVLMQVVYCFFLGILLAYLYLQTENVVYPCLLHFAFNFLNGLLIPTIYPLEFDWVYILVNVLVGALVIGYALVLYFFRDRKEDKPAVDENKSNPSDA